MTPSSKPQKTVIVLGAGRSGTSVTAGILDILGVDLGEVRAPDENNPHGYFEDVEASNLIQEIFKLVGGDWRNPPNSAQALAQKVKIDKKIRKYCLNRSGGSRLWGWKVPGTAPVLELFLPHLVNPHIVAVFRNPLATANSLIKRRKRVFKEEISILEALKVSSFYNSETLEFLNRHPNLPRIFVSFENIVKDPAGQAQKISDFIGVQLTNRMRSEVKEFVIPREKMPLEKKVALVKRYPRTRIAGFAKRIFKSRQ